MNTAAKKWKKPELIILVRGKPEEFVLFACKGAGQPEGENSLIGEDCAYGCV